MKIKISKTANQKVLYDTTKLVCDFLEISPNSIEIDDLHIRGVNGMCIDLSESDFLILIRNRENMIKTLVHELVHVKQYMERDLGTCLDKNTSEYENTWWEIEARNVSDKIMEKLHERNDT